MWGPRIGRARRDPAASTAAWHLRGSGKVPEEEQELKKHEVSSIQTSDQQSILQSEGAGPTKKQLAVQKTRCWSKHPPVTCVLELVQVPPTLQQGHASRIYVKSTMTWEYERWAKSWARTSLPTGSCLACWEACELSWLGISFTSCYLEQFLQSWVSAFTFVKTTVWDPAGYRQKLENSKPSASEYQSKNYNIYSFLMTLWGLWWLGSAGVGRYSSRLNHNLLPQACGQRGCAPGVVPGHLCTTQVCKAAPVLAVLGNRASSD